MKSGSPIVHRWAITGDIPTILAFERRSAANPWNETQLVEAICNRDSIVDLTMRRGQVLGYMACKLHPSFVEVVKFEVESGPDAPDLVESLAARLRTMLSINGRMAAVLNVDGDDLVKLTALRRCGFEATRINQGEYPNRDRYRMRLTLPAIRDELPRPSPRRTPTAALLEDARDKLHSLTSVPWDIADSNTGEILPPARVHVIRDAAGVGLRTRDPIHSPRNAYDALCLFLNQEPNEVAAPNSNEPARVSIPASWIREIHLKCGRTGQLGSFFFQGTPSVHPRPDHASHDRER